MRLWQRNETADRDFSQICFMILFFGNYDSPFGLILMCFLYLIRFEAVPVSSIKFLLARETEKPTFSQLSRVPQFPTMWRRARATLSVEMREKSFGFFAKFTKKSFQFTVNLFIHSNKLIINISDWITFDLRHTAISGDRDAIEEQLIRYLYHEIVIVALEVEFWWQDQRTHRLSRAW